VNELLSLTQRKTVGDTFRIRKRKWLELNKKRTANVSYAGITGRKRVKKKATKATQKKG